MAATDWIKMRVNLWDDPRVTAMCDKIDANEAHVIGGLYWLWATADAHSVDGWMPNITTKGIDRKTGVPGLGEALAEVGWITVEEGGIRISKFDDHNGASAKRRALDAKRKATGRAENGELFPGSPAPCPHDMRTDSGHGADGSPTGSGGDADEMRRIAELDKDKNKNKSKPKPSSPSAQKVSAEQKELEGMGVDPQHAADWLKARKAKNLVATTTAFEQAASEAAKLGWTFPEAIAYAAGKGWGGFMAKWVENDGDTGYYGVRNGAVTASAPAGNTKGPKNKAQVQGEQLDAAAAEFAANMAAKYGSVDGPASQDPAAYVPPNDGMTFDME